MLAHHLQLSAAIKPTLNQRLMAWWEICWIHTNSLARWPLTTAIIAGARWQSVIGRWTNISVGHQRHSGGNQRVAFPCH